VEEILKNERRRNASNFNKFKTMEIQKNSLEVGRIEEKLRKRFAGEKAIALSEMETKHADEIHKLKMALETDYKKKLKKIYDGAENNR